MKASLTQKILVVLFSLSALSAFADGTGHVGSGVQSNDTPQKSAMRNFHAEIKKAVCATTEETLIDSSSTSNTLYNRYTQVLFGISDWVNNQDSPVDLKNYAAEVDLPNEIYITQMQGILAAYSQSLTQKSKAPIQSELKVLQTTYSCAQ